MDAISELRQPVLGFAAGRVSFEDFSSWFVETLLDLESSDEQQALSTFYIVDGVLGEASHAQWDQAGLRHELVHAVVPFEPQGHEIALRGSKTIG